MASTIIIKNGTSGTPNVADMSQGEMAMNVANGQLFYGTVGGTAVSSSFTFTQVTASNAKISNAVIDLPDENALTMGGESFTAAVIMNQATLASTVGVAANNTADETVYLTHVDGATGTQAIETDTGLTYNPASNYVTASGGFLAQSTEGIYADKIRRASDSGNTTKILLNDEVIKLNAGHSSNEVVNISSGVVDVLGNITSSGTIVGSNTVKLANTKEFQGASTQTGAADDNWYHSNNESENAADKYADDTSLTGAIADGSAVLTPQQVIQGGKYLVPTATTASVWRGAITNKNGNNAAVALVKASPADNSNTNLVLTVIASASISGTGNAKPRTFNATIQNPNLEAGDIIVPLVNRYDTSGGSMQFNSTLLFYTEV